MRDDGAVALAVDGVSYRYGARQALDDVSFGVRRGDVFALLGPNGAGKSTLIGVICGRKRPAHGTVRVAGRDPARAAAARHAIGLVPQDIALFPHLTVAENLSVFGRLCGLRGQGLRHAIETALERTSLAARAGQLVATLSGGYKRRANIAAAILHVPSLLVLDEPTVGVDVEARNAINGFLRDLAADGTAVLITTHDLAQAEAVSDAVGILKAGRLIDTGRPEAMVRARFGSDRELVIVFAGEPGEAAARRLATLGFWRMAGDALWHGRLTGNTPAPDALSALLEADGAQVREMRVRLPGLDSLYADVLSDGADAAGAARTAGGA